MGGAFTSMYDDPSSAYWNPGSIAHSVKNKFQITNANWLLDTNWLYGSGVYKLDYRTTVAANFFYLDYGQEEITTLDLNQFLIDVNHHLPLIYHHA